MPIDIDWVKNYMRQHLSATLRVKEIASAAKKHPSDIEREYRDEGGSTIKRDIDWMLGRKLLRLVSKNPYSESEIRKRLGFASHRQFCRWHKRIFEVPFSTLRTQVQFGGLQHWIDWLHQLRTGGVKRDLLEGQVENHYREIWLRVAAAHAC